MATKFGYIERQATNNINWDAIGKQVVSNLQLEAQVRQEKKDAIDAASREEADRLRNAPQGESLTINEFTLSYANDAQQLLLQQDKLLKAGLLSPKDYAVVRANLNESTNTMFALTEEYQAEYERKMERYKNNESSELEAFQMESVEGLANINSSKALINPDSGVVSIGLWEDGSMDGDPSSYATVNELRNRIKSEYDRFNSNEAVASNVQTLGGYEWAEVIKGSGGGDINQVISNMDQTQREGYEDWEKNVISSMTSNPFNVASMLTDEIDQTEAGAAFKFTWDKEAFENDETGTLIFLDRSEDPTGVPVMQDSQLEMVDEYLKNKVRNQLDVEQSVAISSIAHTPRRPVDYGRLDKNDRQDQAMNLFGQLYYGTQEEKEVAAQSLRGLNSNIASIDATNPNGIRITYKDGSQEPINYGDNQEDFIIRGVNFALSENDKILDIEESVRRSGLDPNLSLNTSIFESSGGVAFNAQNEMYNELYQDAYELSDRPNFFRDDRKSQRQLALEALDAADKGGTLGIYYTDKTGKPVPTEPSGYSSTGGHGGNSR
jgi:hypothetical protein|tara:strand:+ start:1365 stop:3014 length:1650 start_codon:yes stop_codon:yes gene_type:complete